MPALAPLWVLLAAFAIQLPLALAPGYFSHDELQWAWRARAVDFVPWWDHRETFQFRPLTFNLWMALSRAFFDTPRVFHSILVAWGSLNAALLFVVGRRFGMGARAAAIGAIGFVLTPFAAYTHGWVATIADLIWVSDALVLAWCVLRIERGWVVAVLAFALSFEAILGKEAAAAIPVLCAVAWLLDPARRGRWTAATIGSGLAIALFLAWRAPALLHGEDTIRALTAPGGRLHDTRRALIDCCAQSEHLSLVVPQGALYGFPAVVGAAAEGFDDHGFLLSQE